MEVQEEKPELDRQFFANELNYLENIHIQKK